jgi:hypothetical protein
MNTDAEVFENIFGSRTDVDKEAEKQDDDSVILSRILEERQVTLDNAVVPEEPSAFDRIFTQPGQRFLERGSATVGRVGEQASLMTQGPSTPVGLADVQVGTDYPSVLLQTVGNPISLGFDVLANTIMVGAEGAFGLLPDAAKEGTMEFLNSALQTEAGQLAMKALSEGSEAWEEYSEKNPNEAANWASFFEIQLGLPKRILTNFSPDLQPIKVSSIGTRKVTRPLAGIDKDIYNIAYSSPKKSIEQAKLTTDPRGPLRTQQQLASQDQLDVIDELKRAGVKGNLTLQQNLNRTQEYLEKLDRTLLGMSRRRKIQTIDDAKFREYLGAEFREMVKANPRILNNKAAKKKLQQNYDEFLAILKEQGNTAEGFLNARRIFDDRMRRSGVDVGGSKLNADTLVAHAVRRAGNRSIFDVVPEAEDILGRQSKILSVQDNIATKAANESQTAVGRYIQELGLDKYVGETITSQFINAAATLGLGVAASPVVILKRLIKAETPANIRAKVSYALNDIFKEIEKGLARTKDPVTKKSLLAQRALVYSTFKAAGEQIIAEAEQNQEDK